MLSETVKRFVRAPQFRKKFHVISLLAIHYYRSHADFVLREQRLACGILKRDAAILARDDDFQLRSAQPDGVFRGLHLPLCYRPTVFYHYEFWTRGKRRRRGIAHPNDRIGAHLQFQRSVLQRQSHSVGRSEEHTSELQSRRD